MRPTNSSMAATRLFISFMLVRAGCVLALELLPLSPLMALTPPGGEPEFPEFPFGSCKVSRMGVSLMSPFSGWSRVYWLRPNRPRRAVGRPVLRKLLMFDLCEGDGSPLLAFRLG